MASALVACPALPVTSLLQHMELCVRSVTRSVLGVRGHSVRDRTRVETVPPAQAPLCLPAHSDLPLPLWEGGAPGLCGGCRGWPQSVTAVFASTRAEAGLEGCAPHPWQAATVCARSRLGE